MRNEPAPQPQATAPRAVERPDGAPDQAGDVTPAVAQATGDSSAVQVTDPVGLLRIASMVKKVDDQLDHLDLDEAAADRLDGIAHEVRADLAHAVSGDLLDEYDRLVGDAGRRRSVAETTLVYAQLTGWLDGVMQGLQLQAATAQVARAQRLAEASARRQPPSHDGEPSPRRDNSYL
ncbi:MAG: proteasome activator [Acidimicrobiales bacterium]